MPQALHIFRKDVRYLWKEIILVLLLCALFARGYSAWIEPLLIVAAGYLIARLIHAEAIPGDRQFWVTRPYRWKSLLTAKLLFIMAFANLPICAAQLSMLISAGFSVTSNLGGLAGSQVLLVLCVSLPIAALAALTPGIMAFILSALILLAAGFTIPQIELPRIRLLRPAPVAPPWPEQVKWVRDAAVLTAVIAGAAGILQYRKRGASWSRTVAFGATACAIASWVFMPPWMALAVQTHLSKHVSEFSTVEIVPDLGTKQLPVRHPNWTADPHLFLPLLVKALPQRGHSSRHSGRQSPCARWPNLEL